MVNTGCAPHHTRRGGVGVLPGPTHSPLAHGQVGGELHPMPLRLIITELWWGVGAWMVAGMVLSELQSS